MNKNCSFFKTTALSCIQKYFQKGINPVSARNLEFVFPLKLKHLMSQKPLKMQEICILRGFYGIRWLKFGGKIDSKCLVEAGSQCEKLPWQLQCSRTQLVFFKFLAYRKHWNVFTLPTQEMKVSAVTYTIYHSIINSIHKCNCN